MKKDWIYRNTKQRMEFIAGLCNKGELDLAAILFFHEQEIHRLETEIKKLKKEKDEKR